ncbi:hypothetical protein [Mycolicibacterium pyrenivorans]|uniref:hypothetical protein n=1 Tax=Mycolicibacterium pyrenivorans TaxID=187102 RepID=UPI0021F3B636|nr:hypothetical protein [Mycolicibacterium pyrenivorans]MCV7150219.1 hypothetical protein [Mycolicibacterium pyrenivorans]
MELDYGPEGSDHDQRDPNDLIEPAKVREDQEYEDPDTGLWWIEMDFVDCLRKADDFRHERQVLANIKRIEQLFDTIPSDRLTLEDTPTPRDILEQITTGGGFQD